MSSSPAIPTPPIEPSAVPWWKNPWAWLIAAGVAAMGIALYVAGRRVGAATAAQPATVVNNNYTVVDATPDTPAVQELKLETWQMRKLEAELKTYGTICGLIGSALGGVVGFLIRHYW